MSRAAGAAVALLALAAPAAGAGLTNAPALARAYDAIFDAEFAHLPALLDAACGTGWAVRTAPRPAPADAPPYACRVVDLASRWWQVQVDPLDRSGDADFERRANAAVSDGEAWTTMAPGHAEAWFYLGAAYGVRVQWRALRGERLAAARDGKRIKDALERALSLDPGLHDAYFGIGLYHYYADVAPVAAKMLRWLLLLPGGDRAAGLREMLRARDDAQLLRDEADYQLHTVYLWYEKQPERALALVKQLQQRHRRNPLFAQAVAEIEDVHLSDYAGSLRTWRGLFEDAQAGRVAWPQVTEVRARMGMALQLDRLAETDLAIEHLRAVVDAAPSSPVGARPAAKRQLARAVARMRDEWYRLSLDGWRALERGDTELASRALDRALTLRPGDQVTRYRKARLLLAQRNERAAIDGLEAVIASPDTPPHIYAAACLDAAEAHERQGAIGRAIELYELTVAAFGVDPRAKTTAQRALARLTRPA